MDYISGQCATCDAEGEVIPNASETEHYCLACYYALKTLPELREIADKFGVKWHARHKKASLIGLLTGEYARRYE